MNWGPPSSQYWAGTRPRETHRLRTSPTELLHLAIAFAVLTLDFVILQARFLPLGIVTSGAEVPWALYVAFGASAAFTGFLAHEMAHKVVAQWRGLWAEFRASWMGLGLSFITVYFGFLFAAPGATVVDGMGDLEDWGLISIAGPAVNMAVGGAALLGFFALGSNPTGASLDAALGFLAFINCWFGTFNLIPFGPLDGAKVLRWSTFRWVAAMAISATLTVGAFLASSGYL